MSRHVPFVAAFAIGIAVVAAQSQTISESNATVHFLRQLHLTNGGYAVAPFKAKDQPHPSLRATSGIVRVLPKFHGKPRDVASDRAFVDKCFEPTTGGFAEKPNNIPDVFSTAVGLMAAVALEMPIDKYKGPAQKYLETQVKSEEDIRIAAAGLEAIEAKTEKASEWIRIMTEKRNADGTIGKGGEIPRATAGMAMTVLRLGGELPNRDNIIRVMKEGQSKDGGYGATADGPSDLESTYRVVRTLRLLRETPRDPAAVKKFVGVCRNHDGGYGMKLGDHSTASATYYAGFLLGWLDAKPGG